VKQARQTDALGFAKMLYNSVQGSGPRSRLMSWRRPPRRTQPLDGTPGWYTPGQWASGRGALGAFGDW